MEKKYLGIYKGIHLVVMNIFIFFLVFFSCVQKDKEHSDRYVGSINQNMNKTVVTLDLYSQYGTISMNETNLVSDNIINIKKYFFRREKDTMLLSNEFGDSLGPYLIKNINSEQVAILLMPNSNDSLFGINENKIVLSLRQLEK